MKRCYLVCKVKTGEREMRETILKHSGLDYGYYMSKQDRNGNYTWYLYLIYCTKTYTEIITAIALTVKECVVIASEMFINGLIMISVKTPNNNF